MLCRLERVNSTPSPGTRSGCRGGGGGLPGARPARSFCIDYPDCNPGLGLGLGSSPRGAPLVDQKAHCIRRNGEFQHQCVLLMYWVINNLFPTSVGTNTFITIMLWHSPQAVMVERL